MEDLCATLGYQFHNPALLKCALTHPSTAKQQNNQRLEFLGDGVLGLVIADMLYGLFPDEQEGELARRHSALVRGETCTRVARDIGLGAALIMSSGEEAGGGREARSNLEDAMEALIGAIYLDGGIEAAKSVILPRWMPLAKLDLTPPKDPKTALQEWAQARGLPIPTYTLIKQEGSAHAPEFTIEVMLEGQLPVIGVAGSKRLAEHEAAKQLLANVDQA